MPVGSRCVQLSQLDDRRYTLLSPAPGKEENLVVSFIGGNVSGNPVQFSGVGLPPDWQSGLTDWHVARAPNVGALNAIFGSVSNGTRTERSFASASVMALMSVEELAAITMPVVLAE